MPKRTATKAASVSAGLVTWHTAPQSIEELFVEADAFMYSAKRNGGDRHLETLVIG
jgi:PleD family two-component response regulator